MALNVSGRLTGANQHSRLGLRRKDSPINLMLALLWDLSYTVLMNIKEAKAIVGGLSNPSKMPGYGYGLSAFDCAVGSKLRLIKNSTCSMLCIEGAVHFPRREKRSRKKTRVN